MISQSASDIDMTEVANESDPAEDLEKGIISALDTPKVCLFCFAK